MAAGGSDTPGLGTRATKDETSPFPLEFMLAAARAAQSQDETAPFPLELEIVARGAWRSQDETAPFPLELMVVRPDGVVERVHAVSVPPSRAARSRGTASSAHASSNHASDAHGLPGLKWRGVDASPELREYAARIAAGEDLPPFRGPILASDERPRNAPQPPPPDERPGDSNAFVKLALALMVMSAALVASAVLGDDAELRAAGQSIGRWLGGPERSIATFPLTDPAASAPNPCEAATPNP